jgi:hypothetical protein
MMALKRTQVLLCCGVVFAATSCGQPSEVIRLKQLVGQYDFCRKSVGYGGTYTGNVGGSMKIVSANPNAVGFKEEFEVGDSPFSRATGVAEAELRFDAKTKQYLFDFRTVVFSQPRSIKNMTLTYTDNKGWSGSGEMTIGEQRASTDVSISLDGTKGEQSWSILVPNPSDAKVARESYTFVFARRSPAAKKN